MSEGARIPELDGLRGIAIATVLFFHYFFLTSSPRPGSFLAYLTSPGRIGWSGVDLFFVLSGFLIGGILLDARDSSNFYSVFYARRFFRIVPAYFSILAIYLFISALSGLFRTRSLSAVVESPLPIVPYFLFLQNFWMGAHNTLGGPTLSMTWSLAIEEQFYLTLPLIIRSTPKRHFVWVLLGGVGVAVFLRAALVYTLPNNFTYAFALMPCRADALLLGVLAAYGFREPRWRLWLEGHLRFLEALLVILTVGMVALIKLLPRIGIRLMHLGGYTWIAAFFLCILTYGLLSPGSWLGRLLRWTWLRSLGLIAYGTYLLHLLILYLLFAVFRSGTPRITSLGDVFLTLTALATTVVICSLSWKYFEKPLVRIGHRWQYVFERSNSSPLVPSPVSPADEATP